MYLFLYINGYMIFDIFAKKDNNCNSKILWPFNHMIIPDLIYKNIFDSKIINFIFLVKKLL